MKKFVQAFLFALFLVPATAFVASAATVNNEFMVAAQLLSAAKSCCRRQKMLIFNRSRH